MQKLLHAEGCSCVHEVLTLILSNLEKGRGQLYHQHIIPQLNALTFA